MYHIGNVIKELMSFFLNSSSTLAAVTHVQWDCGGPLLTPFPRMTEKTNRCDRLEMRKQSHSWDPNLCSSRR